jgi:nucleoside-diphosphate kinase
MKTSKDSLTDDVCLQDVGRNVCHGSDAVEAAQKEIALWFKPEEVQTWKQASHDWVYEK